MVEDDDSWGDWRAKGYNREGRATSEFELRICCTTGHSKRSLEDIMVAAVGRSVPMKVRTVSGGKFAFAIFETREDASEVMEKTGAVSSLIVMGRPWMVWTRAHYRENTMDTKRTCRA